MIREAHPCDLDSLQSIYAYARSFMTKTGNPNQWVNGYPSNKQLMLDMKNHHLYVIEENGSLIGAFMLSFDGEPTYQEIFNGNWEDNSPYGVIHRIAAGPDGDHIFEKALSFAKERSHHLRIDTHRENKVMQNCVKKYGFVYRGIIYLEDGDERLAYEWSL